MKREWDCGFPPTLVTNKDLVIWVALFIGFPEVPKVNLPLNDVAASAHQEFWGFAQKIREEAHWLDESHLSDFRSQLVVHKRHGDPPA